MMLSPIIITDFCVSPIFQDGKIVNLEDVLKGVDWQDVIKDPVQQSYSLRTKVVSISPEMPVSVGFGYYCGEMGLSVSTGWRDKDQHLLFSMTDKSYKSTSKVKDVGYSQQTIRASYFRVQEQHRSIEEL